MKDGEVWLTMRKVFRINVPSAFYIWGLHVKELRKQFNRRLRSNINRLHYGDDERGEKLKRWKGDVNMVA